MAKIKKSDNNNPHKDGGTFEDTVLRDTLKESFNEQKVRDLEKSEEIIEKEASDDDKAAHQKIRQEIEAMDLDDSLKIQAQTQAQSIQFLDAQKKIKNLLQIAKVRGVVYAVKVAKEMNDPYLLDIFHDALAKEGYYKNFIK